MSTIGEVTFSSIDQQQPSSELEDLGDNAAALQAEAANDSEPAATATATAAG